VRGGTRASVATAVITNIRMNVRTNSKAKAATDGRGDAQSPAAKAVRGGSWNDTFRFCRSVSRWRYLPCQPVYNVGFRVMCTTQKLAGAK